MNTFNAIAKDLELCDLGIALTKGKRRKRFESHRKECMKRIRQENLADGLDMSADDIFLELKEDF